MKKILSLLFVLLFIASSCKDAEEHVDYSKDIVGTWNFSKVSKMGIETTNKEINKQIAQGLKDIDKADFDELQGYIRYDEDGKYEAEANSVSAEGTYRLDGRTLTLKSNGQADEKATININARVLEISVEVGSERVAQELEKLTASDPELAAQIKEMEKLGISIIKMSMTMVYTKE